jgi:hypothetical protein
MLQAKEWSLQKETILHAAKVSYRY